MQNDYDLIIVGGGLVGNCLALALASFAKKIAIIESTPPALQQEDEYDARSIALSYGSKLIFEQWQLWQDLYSYATPITHIHVSDKGHAGFVRFNAARYSIPALGYVIEMHHLLKVLLNKLDLHPHVTRLSPATVIAIKQRDPLIWQVDVDSQQGKCQYTTPLLIAADGMNSTVRKLLYIDCDKRTYHQHAIIANIGLTRSHQNFAYERFTSDGPIALLPMQGQKCALVWTAHEKEVSSILQWSDAEFLKQLQHHFGYRLGKFVQVGQRVSYPLTAMYLKDPQSQPCIVLGNAAHTLHPVAGQGFNLCVRDVNCLVNIWQKQGSYWGAIDPLTVTQAYYQARQQDQKRTIRNCESLISIFLNDFYPWVKMRNLGMLAIDLLPGFKQSLASLGMGLNHKIEY